MSMKKTAAIFSVIIFSCLAVCSEPFLWKAEAKGGTLTVTAEVQDGYYFYRSTLILDVEGSGTGPLSPVKSPSGKIIADDMFGEVEVYGSGKWQWIFQNNGPFTKASVNFQGCRRASGDSPAVCFMPKTVNLLPASSPLRKLEEKTAVLPVSLDGFTFVRKLTGLHSASSFSAWLDDSTPEYNGNSAYSSAGFLMLALLALAGGLALNLTPCVLPMIPITLAIIGAGNNSGRQGFLRGLLYGAGMASAYGILGLAVILTGSRFGELQSSMYFNFAIAAVFVLLGLSMAGVFNFDLSGASAKFRPAAIPGGKAVTAFALGGVSALLAGACVAPAVVSILVLATSRYHSDGAAALLLPFLLGTGMALPWPFAGAGLAVLPRPGRYMVMVKYVFAAMIFAAALWYAITGWQLRPQAWSAEREMIKFDDDLAQAAAENKDVIIDFQASWCKNCAAMKKVLADPAVADKLKKFKVIVFRAESMSDPRVSALLEKWQIQGLPAFVMLRHGK